MWGSSDIDPFFLRRPAAYDALPVRIVEAPLPRSIQLPQLSIPLVCQTLPARAGGSKLLVDLHPLLKKQTLSLITFNLDRLQCRSSITLPHPVHHFRASLRCKIPTTSALPRPMFCEHILGSPSLAQPRDPRVHSYEPEMFTFRGSHASALRAFSVSFCPLVLPVVMFRNRAFQSAMEFTSHSFISSALPRPTYVAASAQLKTPPVVWNPLQVKLEMNTEWKRLQLDAFVWKVHNRGLTRVKRPQPVHRSSLPAAPPRRHFSPTAGVFEGVVVDVVPVEGKRSWAPTAGCVQSLVLAEVVELPTTFAYACPLPVPSAMFVDESLRDEVACDSCVDPNSSAWRVECSSRVEDHTEALERAVSEREGLTLRRPRSPPALSAAACLPPPQSAATQRSLVDPLGARAVSVGLPAASSCCFTPSRPAPVTSGLPTRRLLTPIPIRLESVEDSETQVAVGLQVTTPVQPIRHALDTHRQQQRRSRRQRSADDAFSDTFARPEPRRLARHKSAAVDMRSGVRVSEGPTPRARGYADDCVSVFAPPSSKRSYYRTHPTAAERPLEGGGDRHRDFGGVCTGDIPGEGHLGGVGVADVFDLAPPSPPAAWDAAPASNIMDIDADAGARGGDRRVKVATRRSINDAPVSAINSVHSSVSQAPVCELSTALQELCAETADTVVWLDAKSVLVAFGLCASLLVDDDSCQNFIFAPQGVVESLRSAFPAKASVVLSLQGALVMQGLPGLLKHARRLVFVPSERRTAEEESAVLSIVQMAKRCRRAAGNVGQVLLCCHSSWVVSESLLRETEIRRVCGFRLPSTILTNPCRGDSSSEGAVQQPNGAGVVVEGASVDVPSGGGGGSVAGAPHALGVEEPPFVGHDFVRSFSRPRVVDVLLSLIASLPTPLSDGTTVLLLPQYCDVGVEVKERLRGTYGEIVCVEDSDGGDVADATASPSTSRAVLLPSSVWRTHPAVIGKHCAVVGDAVCMVVGGIRSVDASVTALHTLLRLPRGLLEEMLRLLAGGVTLRILHVEDVASGGAGSGGDCWPVLYASPTANCPTGGRVDERLYLFQQDISSLEALRARACERVALATVAPPPSLPSSGPTTSTSASKPVVAITPQAQVLLTSLRAPYIVIDFDLPDLVQWDAELNSTTAMVICTPGGSASVRSASAVSRTPPSGDEVVTAVALRIVSSLSVFKSVVLLVVQSGVGDQSVPSQAAVAVMVKLPPDLRRRVRVQVCDGVGPRILSDVATWDVSHAPLLRGLSAVSAAAHTVPHRQLHAFVRLLMAIAPMSAIEALRLALNCSLCAALEDKRLVDVVSNYTTALTVTPVGWVAPPVVEDRPHTGALPPVSLATPRKVLPPTPSISQPGRGPQGSIDYASFPIAHGSVGVPPATPRTAVQVPRYGAHRNDEAEVAQYDVTSTDMFDDIVAGGADGGALAEKHSAPTRLHTTRGGTASRARDWYTAPRPTRQRPHPPRQPHPATSSSFEDVFAPSTAAHHTTYLPLHSGSHTPPQRPSHFFPTPPSASQDPFAAPFPTSTFPHGGPHAATGGAPSIAGVSFFSGHYNSTPATQARDCGRGVGLCRETERLDALLSGPRDLFPPLFERTAVQRRGTSAASVFTSVSRVRGESNSRACAHTAGNASVPVPLTEVKPGQAF